MGYALCGPPNAAFSQIVSCGGADFVSEGERLGYPGGFVPHQRDPRSASRSVSGRGQIAVHVVQSALHP